MFCVTLYRPSAAIKQRPVAEIEVEGMTEKAR